MEKYTKLFSVTENLYIEGSPVLLESGELYRDNFSWNTAVILKIKNLAENRLRTVRVAISLFDSAGKPISDEVVYQYTGLDVGRGKSFGDTVTVELNEKNAASFCVRIYEAVFDNGYVWSCDGGEVWEALPEQKLIVDELSEVQLAAFRELFGKEEKYMPKKHKDLLICTCGTPNRLKDTRCSLCRLKLGGLADMTKEELHREGVYYNAINTVKTANIPTLLEMKKVFDSLGDFKDSKERAQDCLDKIELIKKEEEQVRLENRAKRKKLVKRLSIIVSTAVILATAILLTVFVFVPMSKYNGALSMMEVGNFDEAREAFRELGSYYDCEQKINMIWGIDKLEDCGVLENWNYDKAIKAILRSGEPVRIVLDPDGGETNGELNTVYRSEQEFFGLADAEKEGYVFADWELFLCEYDRNDCLKLTFRAKWDGTYKINYELSGGSANNPDTYDRDGETIVLSAPKKTGYNFIGWTGEGINKPTLTVTVETGSYGDKTFTANWEPCQYTVYLDPKGGECDSKTLIVTYGEIYNLPTPEREGYTFLNWVDSTGKNYTGGVWSRDIDITLSAKWARK